MSDALYPALPVGPAFGSVHLILEGVEKSFRRLHHTVRHRLRVTSAHSLIRHVPRTRQTRFVPCVWGVRRDDYVCNDPNGRQDVAAFHSAAALMGSVLVQYPVAVWSELLPGTMRQVMGTTSGLYLSDYWTFLLHYLVWSHRLPYPISARWVEGTQAEDARFYFVSELPTDLAEASQQALILFQESALARLSEPTGRGEFVSVHGLVGLPVYRDGRWELPPAPLQQPETSMPATDAVTTAPTVNSADPPESKTSLVVDPESFAIYCGDKCCQFAPRRKQLFALLERISRRPGHRVSFDDLRSTGDVWQGSAVEDGTIRGAITRLRKTLKDQDMADLARRISSGTYQGIGYAVLEKDSGPKDAK